MDALTVLGIFMLGAAAGSIISYAHHRRLMVEYRKLVEDSAGISGNEADAEKHATSGG